MEVSPTSNDEEGTLTKEEWLLSIYKSADEGEDNLMVSRSISSLLVLTKIIAQRSGAQREMTVLIDRSLGAACLFN